MSQENYFFSPPFIGTNWQYKLVPPHSFVPTPVLASLHDLTSAHKHVLPPIFSTIQTKDNSQSTTYCYLALRGALECALRQDIGPFEDLSVLTKFALVQQVVRTCFCVCLKKCIARATRTNRKTTASLFFWIVWQVLGLKKRIRTCFLFSCFPTH